MVLPKLTKSILSSSFISMYNIGNSVFEIQDGTGMQGWLGD